MNDFAHFHGMLCSPRTAKACIKAFNGKILFMPRNYAAKGLGHYEVTSLNIFTYYGLVLQSFTGLSTLLGLTNVVKSLETASMGSSSSSSGVSCSSSLPEVEWTDDITSEIQSYLSSHSTTTASSSTPSTAATTVVCRKFEYYFRLPMITVSMYHLYTPHDDKLHLVEIYSQNSIMFYSLLAVGAAAATATALSFFTKKII